MNAQARPGRVLGAVINYGLGSYVPQLVNFLLVPVYTRYLAPADMGALEIVLSAQALLVLLMRLGLPGALARLHFDQQDPDGEGQRDLMTTVHHTMVVSGLAVSGVWLALGPYAMGVLKFDDVPFHPHMPVAMAGAVLQVAPELQRRLLQVREESALSAKLSAAQGVTTTIFNLLCVIGLGLGALGVLIATTASTGVFWTVAVVRQRRDLTGRFRPELLKRALAYGGPLVPHHVAAWAQQYIGRWVLGGVATAAAVGQISLASRVAAPLAVLIGAFSSAYSPVYFSWRTKLDDNAALVEARKVATTVVALGGIAVIGAATIGGWTVRHLMDARYSDAAPLVGVVAFALYLHLLYAVVTVEIFFSKRTKWISWIFLAAASVTTLLAWMMSTPFGAAGAALAQLAGGAVSLGCAALYARVSFPLSLDPRALAVAGVACLLACAGALAVRPPASPIADGVVNMVAFSVLSLTAIFLGGARRLLVQQGVAVLRRAG